MSIIVGSGIVVVGTALAVFVVSSIRQARNSDNALVSTYASESAIESALYQIRQEELSVLRKETDTFDNNTSWTLENRVTNSVNELVSAKLPKNGSVVADVYQENGFAAVENIQSIKITWDAETNCPGNPATRPDIEFSLVAWKAGGIQWDTDSTVKKAYKAASGTDKYVVAVSEDFGEANLFNQPFVFQVRPISCDLSRTSLTMRNASDAVIPIPNYFQVKPAGSHAAVTRESSAIIPSRQTHSDVFDYTLFSQCDIYKETPQGVEEACQ
ncbi:hypothetical protein HY620_01815 [Candidatus Uhrbacteria bacterium]|nr:hypothetical protein [Candidatus Uhrbacteria bacterium]